MIYKCIQTFKLNNKTITVPGDIIKIQDNIVTNLSTGAKYQNFSEIEDLKNHLQFLNDNPNFSCEDESKSEVHPFAKITDKMFQTYLKKNKDYGNSFDQSLDKWGLSVAAIRLGDKLNRFESYVKNGTFVVGDEGVYDTLADLATYAIMTIMYLNR